MDTDDLSEEAYEILRKAHEINEFLWVELGVLSEKYKNEEKYLKGVLRFVTKVIEDPEWFQDMWSVMQPIDQDSLIELANYIKKVHNILYNQRQIPEY